jgi:hypothetical protein
MVRREETPMRGITLALVASVPLLDASAPPARAQAAEGVVIRHDAVGCMVAGRHPRLEACLDPAGAVSRARVSFRMRGGTHWYTVDMAAEGACHAALLPRPKPSTEGVDYYIEVLDRDFRETRTPEHAPRVVSAAEGCDQAVAGATATASVVVGAPAGAPLVPAGFSPVGIVGMGGAPVAAAEETAEYMPETEAPSPSKSRRSSTGRTLLIGGAVAAAAGAAIALAGGEDPLTVDDDGDGVSENEGDCDDANRAVGPGGGFEFTIDQAFSGTFSCSARNPAQQVYRVRNDSCAPLPIQALQITLTTGGQCTAGTTSYSVPVEVTSVPGASSAVPAIRATAAPARSLSRTRWRRGRDRGRSRRATPSPTRPATSAPSAGRSGTTRPSDRPRPRSRGRAPCRPGRNRLAP